MVASLKRFLVDTRNPGPGIREVNRARPRDGGLY